MRTYCPRGSELGPERPTGLRQRTEPWTSARRPTAGAACSAVHTARDASFLPSLPVLVAQPPTGPLLPGDPTRPLPSGSGPHSPPSSRPGLPSTVLKSQARSQHLCCHFCWNVLRLSFNSSRLFVIPWVSAGKSPFLGGPPGLPVRKLFQTPLTLSLEPFSPRVSYLFICLLSVSSVRAGSLSTWSLLYPQGARAGPRSFSVIPAEGPMS